jgi:hypothetical protein
MADVKIDGFSVDASALLVEASLWEKESLAIGAVGDEADVLRFTKPGVFTLYLPEYYKLVDAIVARCREGMQRMKENRDTLTYIARLYEETEASHCDAIQSAGQLK